MHILLLNHEYPPIGGGGANASRHIAEELVSVGIRVSVLTAAFTDTPPEEIVDGVHVYRVPAFRHDAARSTFPGILAYTVISFLKSFQLPRPDLVHAFFGIPGGAVATALSACLDVPYIVSFRGKDVHGGMSRDFGGIRGMMRTVSLPIWRSANALVANSDGLRQIAESVDPTVSVEVIPNGVDTDRFRPTTRPRSTVPQLLFVGRLEPYKGVDTFLEALTKLNVSGCSNFSARIVGDGSLKADLIGMAKKAGLGQQVEFSGWVDSAEIPAVYQSADIFVLPSVVEGMPNGVLEAMATGLPCVASRVPGTEELIDPGTTGFTFEPGDASGLAEAIRGLLSDEDLGSRAGAAARTAAVNRSWASVAQSYENLYESVVRRYNGSASMNSLPNGA